MRILIDVNLSPTWMDFLMAGQISATHWASIGDPRATDDEIMQHARDNGFVVLTHDLDFGTLLALTRAVGPSVLQVRAQNVLPAAIGPLVTRVLATHAAQLELGALITVDDRSARVRILPIR
jgi:predicted nuclease of predicted toxin-antitoxin system